MKRIYFAPKLAKIIGMMILVSFGLAAPQSLIGRLFADEPRALTGHTEVISSIAFSPDSKTVASASWDKTVRLWDVSCGSLTRTIVTHFKTTETSRPIPPQTKPPGPREQAVYRAGFRDFWLDASGG